MASSLIQSFFTKQRGRERERERKQKKKREGYVMGESLNGRGGRFIRGRERERERERERR